MRAAHAIGSDPRSLAGRPTSASELLGQVLTPPALASRMAERLLRDRPCEAMRILDPCVGPGTFPDALLASPRFFAEDRITGIDVDPAMLRRAAGRPQVELVEEDFLRWRSADDFDRVILNPPYLRQEWLDDKPGLIRRTEADTGARVPGTANVYVHFLVRAVSLLRTGGRLVAIVYDSWRHTYYGRWLQRHLETACADVDYDDVSGAPFRGRLIDATIISARRARHDRPARFSQRPRAKALDGVPGLTSIDAQYTTTRGLRLKQADFFLCHRRDADELGATPFVKRVRHVPGFAVTPEHPEAALLIEPGESRHRALRELRARLERARNAPEANVPILTWARERPNRWWAHGPAPHAPILVNYYLRGRPRHLLSSGLPYGDNFYGLVPRTGVTVDAHLAILNGTAAAVGVLAESRTQGGGLRKVQLFEYRAAVVPDVRAIDGATLDRLAELGRKLVEGVPHSAVVAQIDGLIATALSTRALSHHGLTEHLKRQLAA